jgi:hypothetical protein
LSLAEGEGTSSEEAVSLERKLLASRHEKAVC